MFLVEVLLVNIRLILLIYHLIAPPRDPAPEPKVKLANPGEFEELGKKVKGQSVGSLVSTQ